MNNFIVYLLESGLCLLVFFSLYQVFLKRETYYMLNRAFLLFSLAFSLVVPLLKITLPGQSSAQMTNFQMEPLLVSATRGALATTKQIGISEVIGIIYLGIVLILAIRILLNFRRITRLYSKGRIIPAKKYTLILHSMNYPPFSFFRKIFISENYYTGGELDDIIEHEKAHVKQLHSVDLVMAEMLIILQWFNPMAWLFKNMVTENHEFLADEAVLNRGFSPEYYQLRILTQLFGIRSMPAVHNFNQSVTQKRLKMMEKSKSAAVSRLKILLALPVAIMLFYLFACSSGPNDMSAQDTLDTDARMEVYEQVEVAAEPVEGVMAFRQDLATRIIYPEEAKKNGVQGKIYIKFIIDENGKLVTAVEDSKVPPPPEKDASAEASPPPPPPLPTEKVVMEGIVVAGYKLLENDDNEYAQEHIQLLADEAVRVIKESGLSWKPAIKDGKPVKSAWTIPIAFALE